MQVLNFQPSERSEGMNRLVKQSIAAAATLMLASAAHASLVTYEFTGNLTIGPMGELAVPQAFSGLVSLTGKIFCPMRGMVGKLPSPMPMMARPSESSDSDANVAAASEGCLVKVFMMPEATFSLVVESAIDDR